MKKKIAFILLLTLVLTSATSVFAAGAGSRARLSQKAYIRNEECVYDGEGPQDGSGFQHKSGGSKRLGSQWERPEECLQNGECLYDGEGPQDGTGQQFRSGNGMGRSDRLNCPNDGIGRKNNR